ncbi:MAG: aminopeptidase, partial [Oscillospiraceae bacterium]
ERLAVREGIALAEKAGFTRFERGMDLRPGTKVYSSIRGKALMLAVIGEESLTNGCVIAAAHVDCPRLDLKQNPMYEDSELAYFKTHYYGGIKKYQWTALPLELHGVVALKDGSVVDVSIGKDKNDPQFIITDLLPHLAADQNKKTLSEAITGEGLNILIGSIPESGDGSDRVKLGVMRLLNEKYGITETDFLSAELSAVPAIEPRDQGLDRSLIGGYGHDDRVCAYAELKAVLELDKPKRTAICILADKEEIGSEGVSGMKSEAFECFVEDLCDSQNVKLRHCFEKSLCISADVSNGFDPNYPEVSEKRNNSKLNYGVTLLKYTGARGKSESNDASAELIADIRRILDDNKVIWQMGELGKVDQGGGGTVAMYMSQRNIDTIDAGVPVLSMHAPYEIVAKLDCYMTYKAVKAVYNS